MSISRYRPGRWPERPAGFDQLAHALDPIEVFVSYSREQSEIADRLVDDLSARGFEPKIDRRDLPFGEEWQNELSELIRSCDTVVWLASRASVQSRWVNWELGEVQRRNKRLIPVRIDDMDPAGLPDLLGRIHFLPAEGRYDRERHLDHLVNALLTDRAWIREHTRLGDRAFEWESRGRPSDLLLRGRALADAERWRDSRPRLAPAPGGETLDLVLQSRRASTRRQRIWSIAATFSAAMMLAVTGLAVWQWREASAQKDKAQIEADRANLQREVALGRLEMREQPVQALRRIADAARSNLEQAEAGRMAPLPEVHSALFEAVETGREMPRLRGFLGGIYTGTRSISELRDSEGKSLGRALVTISDTVLVTDMKGRPVIPPAAAPDLGSALPNAAIWLGRKPDSGYAVASGDTASEGNDNIAVTIYDGKGQALWRLLADTPHPFLSLAATPDGDLLLAGNSNGDLYKIDVSSGGTEKLMEGQGKPLTGIFFAFYGSDLVLSYGPRPRDESAASHVRITEADVSRVRTALDMATLSLRLIGGDVGGEPSCADASLSFVFVCGETTGIAVLERRDTNDETDLAVNKIIGLMGAAATAVAYSADLDAVAIGTQDGWIRVFSMDGRALTPALRSAGAITALGFMQGSTELWGAAFTGEIRRWDVAALSSSPDARRDTPGDLLAVSDDDRFWVLVDQNYDKPGDLVLYDKRFADPDKRLRRLPISADTRLDTDRVAITPSGSRIAWVQPEAIMILEPGSSEPALRFPIPPERRVAFLRFDRTGRYLLAGLPMLNDLAASAGQTGQKVAPQLLQLYELPDALKDWRLVKEGPDEQDAPIVTALGLPKGPKEADGPPPVFATGDTWGRIALLSADGSSIYRSEPMFNAKGSRLAVRVMILAEQTNELFVASTAPQGAVANDKESTVMLWSLTSRSPSRQPVDLSRLVGNAAITPAGTHVLISGSFGSITAEGWDTVLYDIDGMRPIGELASSGQIEQPRFLWLDERLEARTVNRFGQEKKARLGLPALLASAATRLDAWKTSDEYDSLLRKLNDGSAVPRLRAIEILTAAARIEDNDGSSWVRLGNYLYNIHDGTGDAQAARAAFDRAIEINPFNVIYHMQRAKLRYRQEDFSGAEADAARATQLPFTYISVARTLGGWEEINISMRKMAARLRANSGYEPAAFHAYALYRQGKWREAADALTTLVHRYGASARDHELLARSLANLGQVEAAANHALEALKRLEGEKGRYSALDLFEAQGNTADRRAMKSCEIAGAVAEWNGKDNPPDEARRQRRIDWLQRMFDACRDTWLSKPAEHPDAYPRLIAARDALLAHGIEAPLPDDMRLPAEEEWPRLLSGGSEANIRMFRDEFAGYPQAAFAGRWLARNEASGEAAPRPDSIYGDWAAGDTMIYRIEPDGEGGQIWRRLDPKDPDSTFGEAVAESRAASDSDWTHIGRHLWGDGEAAFWGDAGQMVVDQPSEDTLFHAYLDSRYRGGWILKRRR